MDGRRSFAKFGSAMGVEALRFVTLNETHAVETTDSQSITDRIRELLSTNVPTREMILAALDIVLAHFDCVVGTVHRFNPESALLELSVHRGVPDSIMDRVASIPIGKGMAGLAAERRAPVQVCNLQQDDSGVAKPGAKDTNMEGSIAVPMLTGTTLCGTLGIAKPTAYEFSQDEAKQLLTIACILGEHLASSGDV